MLNAAFVFIKPHAMTEATKKLVESRLRERGIKIVAEGSLKGKTIDERKLIDQHYYAIASKATIKKPSELNVPAQKFEAHFGLPWGDALASGKVFNALDGCAHFGIDADAMSSAWNEAQGAKKLVKFGGGFYCGLVEIEGKEPVYIFNGFFMSMRTKFTRPDAEIYYFHVQWDAKSLSWADFRGKVLGPTDPAEAPADSLRGQICSQWEKLGLKMAPNVSDNGVHASASPFEGFAERNNWLGINVQDDVFGKQMLAAGIAESMVKTWSVDPQVAVEDGKQGSVFDQLEDMDARACLERLVSLYALNQEEPMLNAAFVFVKPHAMTQATKSLVKSRLLEKGIKIVAEGSLKGQAIDENKLIDQHYYAIASKATILKPSQLNVPADKFEAQFGLPWDEALASGRVFNALDGCAHFGIDADAMGEAWKKTQETKQLVKFGGGFYCGLVEVEGKDPAYIFNGFFMSMRAKFTRPDAEIYYFSVQWDPTSLAWEDFRGKVLGPTNPAEAPADSLRGQILAKWQDLGLKAVPNVSDNGVHASASPFEGFAERNNWLGISVKDDVFGKQLLSTGMSESMVKEWSVDPQVAIEGGKQGSVFDQLEDLDVKQCLDKLASMSKLN